MPESDNYFNSVHSRLAAQLIANVAKFGVQIIHKRIKNEQSKSFTRSGGFIL